MNKDNIKLLLVGKGHWGTVWYKTIFKRSIPFCVVDSTLKPGFDVNGIENFTSLEDALKHPEFTHAIIATPSETHLDIYQELMLKSKIQFANILVEKPCGSSVQDFEYKDGFFPGYLFLYSEPYKYIKEHLTEIGEPLMYRSTRASMGPQPRTDISVVADYLIHDLYIFAELFGFDNIEVVNASLRKHFEKANKSDTVSVQLKRENVFADMFSSWWYPIKRREVIIAGRKGTFLWENDKLRYFENNYKTTHNLDKLGNPRYELFHPTAKDIILTEKMTVDAELEYFLNGNRSAIYPSQVWKLINQIETFLKV